MAFWISGKREILHGGRAENDTMTLNRSECNVNNLITSCLSYQSMGRIDCELLTAC